jgi:hypothetical protein
MSLRSTDQEPQHRVECHRTCDVSRTANYKELAAL